MAGVLSTPLASLPNQGPTTVTSSAEDDPMVKDLLMHMNASIPNRGPPHALQAPQGTQSPQQAPQAPQAPAAAHPDAAHMYAMPADAYYATDFHASSEWWNPEVLKTVVVAAVLAFMIFHPMTLETLFRVVPKLSNLAAYDLFIRPVLFAVLLYAIFLRVPL